jgi:hypothetical protein
MPLANPDLLSTFINTRYDLHRVSQLTHVPVTDLLAWLADPETKRTLDDLRAAAELALALRSLETRRTALDALEFVLNTTDDLIEKRRAATALLRALNTRPPSDPSRVREHATAPSAQRPVLDASPPSLAAGRTPLADPLSQASKPQASKPPPDLHSLLTRLASDLARDDAPTTADSPTADNALAALHAACAGDATLNDKPIPADVDDFLDDAGELRDLRPIAHVDVDPPTLAGPAAATRLTCTHHDHTVTTIAIALVDEDAWRIIAIVIEPDDTS